MDLEVDRVQKILQADKFIGILKIAGTNLNCAVLSNGMRVVSENGLMKSLGKSTSGKLYSIKKDATDQMPIYFGGRGFKPFIDADLASLIAEPILYNHGKGGTPAHGIPAQAIPMICDVWLKARDAGALSPQQKKIARNADVLMRALAHVGIIALVDEATGYQEVRDKKALQEILDKYLLKEEAKWAKCFPDEFYEEMFRLRKWQWKGMKINRPSVVGHYTRDIVYERLAPGVLKELEKRNPPGDTGHRRSKHHQWFTEDIGHPALSRHIWAVLALMKASASWSQFNRSIARAFPKFGDAIEMELGDE